MLVFITKAASVSCFLWRPFHKWGSPVFLALDWRLKQTWNTISTLVSFLKKCLFLSSVIKNWNVGEKRSRRPTQAVRRNSNHLQIDWSWKKEIQQSGVIDRTWAKNKQSTNMCARIQLGYLISVSCLLWSTFRKWGSPSFPQHWTRDWNKFQTLFQLLFSFRNVYFNREWLKLNCGKKAIASIASTKHCVCGPSHLQIDWFYKEI